jgi:hypothetical protein
MSRRASPPKPPTTASLAPSALHIRMEGLETQHQSLLTKIKKKRKELDNFVEQMRSVATEIYQQTTPKFQEIQVLDREIHTLFTEILTDRKLSKKNKHDVERIYHNLQVAGIISPKQDDDDTEFDDMFEPNEKEEEYRDSRKYHQQESESASLSGSRSEESKKIRSYFLRLAEIFHPDKATDSETQMRHTEIMKEINKAYQQGDLARLLEIEQLHQVGESIDSNSEDDLSRKCTQLEQQNQFLKTQYEKLKKELRSFKRTPEGEVVTDCRKFNKQGIDPIAEIARQVESQIKIIVSIRDYVRDFHSSKMKIKEFLCGPEILHSLNHNMIEDFLEQILDEMS